MKVTKTVKARVYKPTYCKEDALQRMTEEWRQALKMHRNDADYDDIREETDLPSACVSNINYNEYEGDQPLTISKESINVWQKNNEISDLFLELYTGKERIWLPIQIWDGHKQYLLNDKFNILNSEIMQKNGTFYIHFVVQTDMNIDEPENVLGIDIGDKHLATSVALHSDGTVEDVNFHGDDIRGVRRHYAWLKKRLQHKGSYRTLKQVSDKEHRRVDDICHNVAKDIVEQAEQHNAVIVMENLTGLHGDTEKGSRMNRIVNEMPHHKLRRYITYKAHWKGIPVIESDPSYTSQTCHTCSQIGKRQSGLFTCPHCDTEYNADANASINIAEGFRNQWLQNGAVQPSAQNATA